MRRAAEPEEQIDLPAGLVLAQPQAKRPRSSESQLAAARAQRSARISGEKAAAERDNAKRAQERLLEVASTLPGVGRFLGIQHGASAVGRRPSTSLEVRHFRPLAVALHMPLKERLNVGVNRARLLLAGRRCILARQQQGIQRVLDNAVACRRRYPDISDFFVTCVYSHEWDETSSVFRYFASGSRHEFITRMGVHHQTMQQRGSMSLGIFSEALNKELQWCEQAICPATLVTGTQGSELLPALAKHIPESMQVFGRSIADLAASVGVFDAWVFAPTCDMASGNILILKFWADTIERISPQLSNKALYLADTCMAHSHQRGKVGIRSLKGHTSKHFSISNLLRQESILRTATEHLKKSIARVFRRVTGRMPQPEHNARFRSAMKLLFGLGAPRADAELHPTPPRFLQDLEELAKLVNDDTTNPSQRLHFCVCDPGVSVSCCTSAADSLAKITRLTQRLLFGRPEVAPGEGKWTYMVKSFKGSILRCLLHQVGVLRPEMFKLSPADVQDAAAAVDEDGQADEAVLRGIRLRRACSYYSDRSNMFELGVIIITMTVGDTLFYTLLGGSDRSRLPSKVPDLLRRRTSPVVVCMQGLLHLVGGGWADADDERWGLLHLLGAPMQDERFMKYALGQLLRVQGFVFRRYQVKFSGYPFKLFGICDSALPEGDRRAICEELLRSPDCCLDSFARGLRRLFGNAQALMTPQAASVVRTTLQGMRLSTDFSERSHAQCRCTSRTHTGPRAFGHVSNELVMKQGATVHTKAGGMSIAAARRAGPESSIGFAKVACPLLMPPSQAGAPSSSEVPADIGPPGRGAMRRGAAAAGNLATAGRRPSIEPQGDDLASVLVGGAEGRLREVRGAALTLQNLVEPLSLPEARLAPLAAGPLAAQVGQEPEPGPQRPRRGLNPQTFYTNQVVKAARAASNGRRFSKQEIAVLQADASQQWSAMPEAIRAMHVEAFKDWQSRPLAPSQEATAPQVYRAPWGVGCPRTFVPPESLLAYVQQHGWPADEEVYHSSEHKPGPLPNAPDLNATKGYNLWGRLRAPRNICRASLGGHEERHDMMHTALANYVDRMGRDRADSGHEMVLFRCKVGGVRSDGPDAPPDTFKRRGLILCGVSYNPRASDWTVCSFAHDHHSCMEELPLPCHLALSTAPCRITSEALVMQTATSSEVVAEMSGEGALLQVDIFAAEYGFRDRSQGILANLELRGMHAAGQLWRLGATAPCVARPPRERAAPGLLAGDPLEQPPPAQPRAAGRRGRGHGGQGGRAEARGRGRGRGRLGGPDAPPPVPIPALADGSEADLSEECLDNSAAEGGSEPMSDDFVDEMCYLDEEACRADPGDEHLGGSGRGGERPDTTEAVDDVACSLAAAAVASGLADDSAAAVAASGSASSAGPAPPPPPPPPPQGIVRFEDLVLYPSGRIWEADISTIGSITRGKPRGSIAVACKLHSKCTFVLPLWRDPGDEAIKAWLVALPRNLPSDSPGVRKEKTERHLALAAAWKQGAGQAPIVEPSRGGAAS